MALISDAVRSQVEKRFKELKNPVKIVNFTQEIECEYCAETRRLMEEIAAISDKLSLEVYNFVTDKEKAKQFRIDKIPATVIMGDKDYGIRFYGIPSGYEFVTVLESIAMVSRRESGLSTETKKKLASLTKPLHLEVFVTPTCPYCPQAVQLAHQFAMESDMVTADMVEAMEFPHLAQRYGVMGVPKTIANGRSVAEGALPEAYLIANIMAIVEKGQAS